MSDRNTTAGHGSEAAQKMSELLPLVARDLRSLGIIKAYAPYAGQDLALLFMGKAEQWLPDAAPVVAGVTPEIRRALLSILERRYPEAMKTEGACGHFEWDLAADTLRHEHVMTHHGV